MLVSDYFLQADSLGELSSQWKWTIQGARQASPNHFPQSGTDPHLCPHFINEPFHQTSAGTENCLSKMFCPVGGWIKCVLYLFSLVSVWLVVRVTILGCSLDFVFLSLLCVDPLSIFLPEYSSLTYRFVRVLCVLMILPFCSVAKRFFPICEFIVASDVSWRRGVLIV